MSIPIADDYTSIREAMNKIRPKLVFVTLSYLRELAPYKGAGDIEFQLIIADCLDCKWKARVQEGVDIGCQMNLEDWKCVASGECKTIYPK